MTIEIKSISGKVLVKLEATMLREADLHGADLRKADLHGADLHWADLRKADLQGADLHGANLFWADLRRADLHGANLHGANLREVDLEEADLRESSFCVTNLLQINWGKLSNKLTLVLMRHDAEACGEVAMTNWAKNNGLCPFQKLQRDFNFIEKKSLWKPGQSKLRGMNLLKALCKEKNIKL